MFIHWGIYAAAARHKWVKNREKMSDEEYQKHFDHFDPDLYDPRLWTQEAKNAGMKYFVVTTKHHDGLAGKVEYAQLLNDASEIPFHPLPPHQQVHGGGASDTLTLELPVRKPDVVVPVIELFLKE